MGLEITGVTIELERKEVHHKNGSQPLCDVAMGEHIVNFNCDTHIDHINSEDSKILPCLHLQLKINHCYEK